LAAPDNPNPETSTGFRFEGPLPDVNLKTGYQPDRSQLHAKTASKLAGWLVGILTGSIVMHYVCIMILIFLKRDDGVKVLQDALHSWLPVLSGLAGGAATYYFSKEPK
jgi:hypothetical protein